MRAVLSAAIPQFKSLQRKGDPQGLAALRSSILAELGHTSDQKVQ